MTTTELKLINLYWLTKDYKTSKELMIDINNLIDCKHLLLIRKYKKLIWLSNKEWYLKEFS